MKISSTCALSACGAANLAEHRRSILPPTRCSSPIAHGRFPVHIFDLHTAYLAAANILLPYEPDEVRKKPRKRLPDACRAYGIEGWERIDKDTIAEDIGCGRWQKYGGLRFECSFL
jgi:hypothetical protein